jgi:UBX domain-containing protein 1
LAVEPNHQNDILGTIRSNAIEASSNATPNGNNNPTTTTRRTITMYRSGFTIDNGPFRRLDDPNNADFLRDLARGVTPRELFIMDGDDNDNNDASIGDMEVGLVDKRHLEYEDDDHSQTMNSANNATTTTTTTTTTAFTGVGQSLGSSNHYNNNNNTSSSSSNGIITPSTFLTSSPIPSLDESQPITSIQIRLHNGKKIIVKCNLQDTIHTFVSRIIQQQQDNGNSNEQSFVLSSGYPPRVLNDMNKTVEECGLKNAQVIQKLV